MSDIDLLSYLQRVLPRDCSYEDAVRLHVCLFCTLAGVPSDLHSHCSRRGLSHAFSALAQAGRIRRLPIGVAATEPRHWSRILDDMLNGTIDPALDLGSPPGGAP